MNDEISNFQVRAVVLRHCVIWILFSHYGLVIRHSPMAQARFVQARQKTAASRLDFV
jgi:hypothetical protein